MNLRIFARSFRNETDEHRAQRLRDLILRREPGGCATLVGGWILLGGFAGLAHMLQHERWLQDWGGPLSRFIGIEAIWSGLARAYALRSARPLAFAAPFAVLGFLLSEHFFGRATGMAWAFLGIVVFVFNLVSLAFRLRWPNFSPRSLRRGSTGGPNG